MLTPSDYMNLYQSATLTADSRRLRILASVGDGCLANRALYETVQRFVMVPWPLVAAIHFRESNQSLFCHLHNGDPLTDRTIRVPKGRPEHGSPPFTWIESAIDALADTWRPQTWSIAGCLEFAERYNGMGYQHHGVNTPYVWNYTDKYTSGLFVGDGAFSATKVEDRPGCAAILRTLFNRGVSLDFTAVGASDSGLH